MKRRILILALAAIMLLSASACGQKASAFDVYSDANAKLQSVKAMEATMEATMSMVYGEETIDITMSGVIKELIHSETDIEFSAELAVDMAMLGMAMDMSMYFKDGYYYMEVMGQKVKMELPLEKALEQVQMNAVEFDEAAIKESSLVAKDGGKELSFTLDGAAMTEMVDKQVSGLLGSMGDMGLAGMEYNYGDIIVTAFVDKDGNMKTMGMVMSFDMTMEGESISAEIDMQVEYVAFDDDVKLDIPADLDSFVEVDSSVMGM